MKEDPLTSDSLEETLRRRLNSLADGAPAAISDLDRELARRVARARQRRRTGFGAAAIAVLVCGAGLGGAWALSARDSPQRAQLGPPPPAQPDPLACPQDLGTFTLKTAHPGLSGTMVPGAPGEARICGYPGSTGHLVVVQVPAASELPPLTAQLNAAGERADAACAKTQAGRASEILVRFGYPAGAEVDVLVTLSGTACPSATNGVLRGALPAALTIPYLDDLGQSISPAPASWTTSGNTARPTRSPGQAGQSSSPPREPVPSSSSQPAPVPPSGTPRAEAGTGTVPASRSNQAVY
jgi:hypothetical protein